MWSAISHHLGLASVFECSLNFVCSRTLTESKLAGLFVISYLGIDSML